MKEWNSLMMGDQKKKVSNMMLKKLMDDKSIRVLDIAKPCIFNCSALEIIILHLKFSPVLRQVTLIKMVLY